MKTTPGTASYADTRREAVKLTGRGYGTPRGLFVQLPSGSPSRPSSLGHLVNRRKHRAILLYLLLVTLWPALSKRTQPFTGKVWARLLSTDTTTGMSWTASEVSDAWKDLESAGLITRQRRGRYLWVEPRREDGQADYTTPGGVKGDLYEAYFVLPGELWLDEVFAALTLPELAVLLIVLNATSDKKEVWLTGDRAPEWYGISPETFRRGTKGLETRNLLERRPETIQAPLSPTGSTTRWWYSLRGPYSLLSRRAAQRAAQKGATARTAKAAPPKKATRRKTTATPSTKRRAAQAATVTRHRVHAPVVSPSTPPARGGEK